MKLSSHGDLIKIATLLGYNEPTGLCVGYTLAWSYAVLANDEDAFYERLNFISTYSNDFEQLIKEIEYAKIRVQQIAIARGRKEVFLPLTDKELKLLNIPAFFDRMIIHHTPFDYPALFNTFKNQSNIKCVGKLAKPSSFSHKKVYKCFNHLIVASKEELFDFFNNLAARLEKTIDKFTIGIDSVDHHIGLSYNIHTKLWNYVDINDLQRYPSREKYYEPCDTRSLVEHVFNSFLNPSNVVIAISILSQTKGTKVFKGLRGQFPLTANQVHIYDKFNQNMLMLASINGKLNIVRKCLYFGSLLNAANTHTDATSLYFACQNGYIEIVKELLRHEKLDINKACNDGATPLFVACINGHLAIVKELLQQKKLDINKASCGGATSLYIACQNGYHAIVKELLRHEKLDINKASNYRATPLFIACQNGHLGIVKELLQYKNLDINKECNDGSTPLFIACYYGHLEIVKELLKRDDLIIDKATFSNNITPLEIAKANGYAEIALAIYAKLREKSLVSSVSIFKAKNLDQENDNIADSFVLGSS